MSAFLDVLHFAFEVAHCFGVADARQFFFATLLILFLEDCAGKTFEWLHDVPFVAIVQLLMHIVLHPLLHFRLAVHSFDEAVHSTVYYLVVREFHLQIGGKPQFACHVAQDALEERVDGLHAEVGVVMQDGCKDKPCPFSDLLLCDGNLCFFEAFENGIHVVVRLLQTHLQPVERFQNTPFHFCRCLVGEGDGKDVFKLLFCMGEQKSHDVFHGKSKCLARTGRSLIDAERLFHENAVLSRKDSKRIPKRQPSREVSQLLQRTLPTSAENLPTSAENLPTSAENFADFCREVARLLV